MPNFCIKRTLRYEVKDTCFINKKAKTDVFTATKMFKLYFNFYEFKLRKPNSHLSYTLGEICTSNQAQILTALNHCLDSSEIVTVTARGGE